MLNLLPLERIHLYEESPLKYSQLFCLGMLLISAQLTGCAAQAPDTQRYFWPPAVERPRIEYLNFIQTDQDVEGQENPIFRAIFGELKPSPIFQRPQTVHTDSKGRVYVADTGHGQVLVLDLEEKRFGFLQSDTGQDLRLGVPGGMASATDDTLYLADISGKQVLVFGADNRLRRRIGDKVLQRPTGLAYDSQRSRLYVTDSALHQVLVFAPDGRHLDSIGARGNGEGMFNFPVEVDLDAEGNLYVLDALNALVQVFDPAGNHLRQFGERGTALGSFQIPKSLAISPSGHIYITDSMAHRVVVFDLQGNHLITFGGRNSAIRQGLTPGGLYLPAGIHVDRHDTIWIADTLNRLVHRFQYLTDDYLEKHPILPGETYLPPEFFKTGGVGR